MEKRYIIKYTGLFESGYLHFKFFAAKIEEKKFATTKESFEYGTKFRFKWYADLICKLTNQMSQKEFWMKEFFVVPLINGEEDKHFYIKRWYDENKPLGVSLGYPSCCVEAFCCDPPELYEEKDRAEKTIRYEAGCIDGKFTGFIPCINCANKIRSGKIGIESLINNRDPKLIKFPFYGGFDQALQNESQWKQSE